MAPGAECQRPELHVLVTGFGPFMEFKTNASYEIARALPKYLPPTRYAPAIHVHVPSTYIETSYQHVLDRFPKMLFSTLKKDYHADPSSCSGDEPSASAAPEEGASDCVEYCCSGECAISLARKGRGRHPRRPKHPPKKDPHHPPSKKPADDTEHANYDLVLSLGMASGWKHYTLETQAHGSGYTKFPDNEKKLYSDPGIPPEWAALKDPVPPAVLQPSFEVGEVWRAWKREVGEEDVRPNDDAGRFCCDFIYYTGLLEYWKREVRERKVVTESGDEQGKAAAAAAVVRPVMFCHVPGEYEKEDIQRGARAVTGLLRALGENLMLLRKTQAGLVDY